MEMEIKNTMRYYYITTRIKNKILETSCVNEDVDELEFSCTTFIYFFETLVMRVLIGTPVLENWQYLLKSITQILYNPRNSIYKYILIKTCTNIP